MLGSCVRIAGEQMAAEDAKHAKWTDNQFHLASLAANSRSQAG